MACFVAIHQWGNLLILPFCPGVLAYSYPPTWVYLICDELNHSTDFIIVCECIAFRLTDV